MTLLQNHVEWIFPAFFNCLHWYANWWFSWHRLSETKSLKANFSRLRISELLQRFFLSIGIFCLWFLDFNFTVTVCFFRRWHAWKPSGITLWLVRERVLQTFSSSSSSLIDAGTGLNSINLRRWYRGLLTAFLWLTLSLKIRIKFFETANLEDRISNLLVKSSNRVVRFVSLEEIYSMLMSSSINASFEWCSNWLLAV